MNNSGIDIPTKHNHEFVRKMRMASQIINKIKCLFSEKLSKELELTLSAAEFSDLALR